MARLPVLLFTVAVAFAVTLVAGPAGAGPPDDDPADALTPVTMSVRPAPIAFPGSDGDTHLVYELAMTNYSSADVTVDAVEVLDASDDTVLETLDADDIADRLQPAGSRAGDATMAPAEAANLFVHVALAADAEIPRRLVHSVAVVAQAAPPGQQDITEEGGTVRVRRPDLPELAPPLRGERFVAADGCCDATRHTRAILPVNGDVWVAQRYAIDYEQVDEQGLVYSGDPAAVESYPVYGDEALSVADATVVHIIDDLPEQIPGALPESIPLTEADGNSVILDLGGGFYGLYAHFQPGSIRVEVGDEVEVGDVLGLVGNSGNSSAPHLHFHVMSTASPLASNGVPYTVDEFTITGQSSTEAFDAAETTGIPLDIEPVDPPTDHRDEMPLDQNIITFP
ncbi:MAG: M23 family metallopeptidase [Acidimicrobiia bacterium]